MQLAASYVAAATALKAAFPALADDVTLTSVLRFPDVLKQDEQAAADEELLSALKKALSEALDNLNRMREDGGREAQSGYAFENGLDRGARERNRGPRAEGGGGVPQKARRTGSGIP